MREYIHLSTLLCVVDGCRSIVRHSGYVSMKAITHDSPIQPVEGYPSLNSLNTNGYSCI